MKPKGAKGPKGERRTSGTGPPPRDRTPWVLLVILALLLAALSYWHWNDVRRQPADKTAQAEPIATVPELSAPEPLVPEPPLPVPRSSPYLNTRGDAQYVGSDRCQQCHSEQHNSYLASGHARSFSLVDAALEPSDGTFNHEPSRRRLRSFRANGQLRHSESLLLADGNELPLYDRSLKYLVGSGRFARTYLAEVDGCLVESPLSWYTSLQAWRMSPGYDLPRHPSFRRDVDADCLHCHVGHAETRPGSLSRLTIREPAIGCERCHGPGSLHVSAHERGEASSGDDFSIVNPRRLPRDLAEAICHQCHLESATNAVVRGRKREQFRPGLEWTDFVVNYTYQRQQANMTVTGHVEQMHASRCYQASDQLTCTTCHDPHHSPRENEKRAHYRAACLACHEEAACQAPPTMRAEKNQDDCAACHMPASKVEIPHLAFTHHRIAIHPAVAAGVRKDSPAAAGLEPVLDISRLPEIDKQRLLGLAYWHHYAEKKDALLPSAGPQAWELLNFATRNGLRDGTVTAPLAALALDQGDTQRAKADAQRALADQALSPRDRVLASELLAALYVQEGRVTEAMGLLNQLIELRPHPQYWFLLGVCRQQKGDLAGAIQALERVIALDPAEPATYRAVANLYQLRGDNAAAQRNIVRADLIEAALPK